MDETYKLQIAGLERDLTICKIADDLYIAAFIIFGDVELTVACARELIKKVPPHDIMITAESKGIPLIHEMARQMGVNNYIVARKMPKLYMKDPFQVEVQSITTSKKQTLCIDTSDAALMQDKRVLIIDDVISTGEMMGLIGDRRIAAEINVVVGLATFIAGMRLAMNVVAQGPMVVINEWFFVDSFNVFLVALTTFVTFTTTLFSRPYMRNEQDKGKLSPNMMRLYHSMFQIFVFTMLLALLTNNIGILWVAMEAATLATVLLVSLYRTPASLEAAWKYFILCGVGIAQALFGTILLYFAAERLLGSGGTALLWTHLYEVKEQLEPTVLGLAFVFLLVGYGTKVGLAPLHNWLPDAHAEGPTPISAVLSGLLLNVALYAVVRSKVLVDGALGTRMAGNLMIGFGLLSVVVAAFFLLRQRDVKRLFAYSSIEHMGLTTFAFGMGGQVATFAALLHMTVHSLTKSAIFFTVGHAAQKTGTQVIDDIRGLVVTNPAIGWGLMFGSLAILGMPPFGVFASEFLILTTAMRDFPWATPFLLIALGVAFAAIFGKVQAMVFGDTTAQRLPHSPALLPVFAHLALVLMLGFYIPPYLAAWYRQAAQLIG